MDYLLSNPIFAHKDSITLAKKFIRKCKKEPAYIKRLGDELECYINRI